jgi:hypothetical protein
LKNEFRNSKNKNPRSAGVRDGQKEETTNKPIKEIK